MVRVVFGDAVTEILETEAWPPGLDTSTWSVALGPFGKPAFADHPEAHFNKSHTPGAVALAVWDRPIGVDIEAVGRYDERIVRRFFSVEEQRYVHAAADDVQTRFTEVWTRKEALVKWRGDGLRHRFDLFDTTNDQRLRTRLIDGFVVSVCADFDAEREPEWVLRRPVDATRAESNRGAA